MVGHNDFAKQLLAAAAAFAITLTSTLVTVGPVDGPEAEQVAAAFNRDGSPATQIERA